MCGWADQFTPEPVEAERVTITPGTSTRYRVWLDGRCVAIPGSADLALAIKDAINRQLARAGTARVMKGAG